MSLLAHEQDASASAEPLVRAFASLPPGARVLHVGVMLGRPTPSIRLSVLLPGAAAADYLRRIGRNAAAGIAGSARATFGDLLSLTQLDFDLAPAALERIGFGLRPASAADWGALLDRLSESVTIGEDKRAALLRWPGESSRSHPDGGAWRMRREISHVKLACAESGEPQLKAYIGVTPMRAG